MRVVYSAAIVLITVVTLLQTEAASQSITDWRGVGESSAIRARPDYGLLARTVGATKGKKADLGSLSPVFQIVGSDSLENAFFGLDVAVEGNTAVVGAYNEVVEPYRTGAAYVYTWNGSSWIQQQKLTRPPISGGGDFGRSVDISGDTIIIGDPDHSCGASAVDCGEIFFFQRTGSTWTQAQRVRASDWEDTHQFGWDVAISGDWAVIGENARPVNTVSAGSAYFFQRIGGVWTEVQKVTHGANTNDLFGYSVAIEDDRAIIGFPRYANYLGGACVYNLSGSTWTLGQCLAQNDPGDNCLGESTSISGDTILVGAPCNDGGAGYVFVTEDDGTTWDQEAKLTVPEGGAGDGLGVGAGIDGDRAVLGAWLNNGLRGAGYSFVRCLNDWAFEEKFVAAGGAPEDYFGRSAAVAANRAIFGAPFTDVGGIDDRGAAYATVIESSVMLGAQCDLSIEVNRTTDEPDDDIDDDVCDIDENTLEHECTFRAAIETANARTGRDVISFDIPGGGIKTISPGSNLPYLDESASIDATSQPGYAGQPLIQLSGGAMGVNPGLGFIAGSDNSRVKGLAIYGFETNIAIQNSGSSVEACYLGIKADGTAPTSALQSFGVALVNGASNNFIGGTDDADGNVIGSLVVGVGIYNGSNSNRILNNKIGTNAAGSAIMPTEIGVLSNGSNGTRIGQAGDGNLISGSTFAGVVLFDSSATMVRSNKIGTNAAGTAALPNLHGIAINGGSNNKIGDLTIADGNLVSGNTGFGVVLYNSSNNNRIIHNSVGTTVDGTGVLGNGLAGVFVEGGANNNTIEKNVVGGHNASAEAAGIGISATSGTGNVVKGNFIGVVRDGTAAIPNRYGIVSLSDSQTIGAQDEGNVIGHNQKAGIGIAANASGPNPVVTDVIIHHNLIGTNGTADIGNGDFGILVEGAVTETTISRNIISGNTGFGIALTDDSYDNLIKENFVGTNLAGNAVIANGGGIWLRQSLNNRLETNLVSGNGLGILVGTNIGFGPTDQLNRSGRFKPILGGDYTTGNRLFGNTVGLNAQRNATLPNVIGIAVGENARDNMVGPGAGENVNIISGNTDGSGYGVMVGTLSQNADEDSFPQENSVQGNLIGISGDLTSPIPNDVGIVLVRAFSNHIGVPIGNYIAASNLEGVLLQDEANVNDIENNKIGIFPDSTFSPGRSAGGHSFGSGLSGIAIKLKSIGNKVKNNTIGNSGGNGIEIETPDAPDSDDPTLITGNMIGVMPNQDNTGFINVANALSGIMVKNSKNVQIGDIGPENINVIAKNVLNGITVSGNTTAITQKTIKAINNMLGLFPVASGPPLAAGNGQHGILGENVAGLIIGGEAVAAGNKIGANVGAGIRLSSLQPTATQPVAAKVKGNYIGAVLDAVGNLSTNLGNLTGGIQVDSSDKVEIGPTEPDEPGNVIASNLTVGVKSSLSRHISMIKNAVFRNQGPGYHLYQSSENKVIGSGVGLALGMEIADSGNNGPGVLIEESPGNTIGGSLPSEFNQIGRNLAHAAIHILNTHPGVKGSSVTRIEGNLLGARATTFGGIVNRASNAVGVLVENSSDVAIGGNEATRGNSVVASSGPAVRLLGSVTRSVRMASNFFGKVASHHGTSTEEMGNDGDGVTVLGGATGNEIGMMMSPPPVAQLGSFPAGGNVIADNGGAGVRIAPDGGNNNLIVNNSIYGNSFRGIEIGAAGVTPNDPADADVGPNNLQNYPYDMTFQIVGGDLLVTFKLDSAPAHSNYGSNGILIDFFESDALGQGERFLGSGFYTEADYNNGAPLLKTVNLGNAANLDITLADKLTASATDAAGNTSEFTPPPIATSAGVSVSGRVSVGNGSGLRNAIVSITDSAGNRRTARTGSFGYYRFDDIQAGETYVIAVTSKRFTFAPRIVVVSDTLADVDFEGIE